MFYSLTINLAKYLHWNLCSKSCASKLSLWWAMQPSKVWQMKTTAFTYSLAVKWKTVQLLIFWSCLRALSRIRTHCCVSLLYSAHAPRHALHDQPDRYRRLCQATLLTTQSLQCLRNHPLTCERSNGWKQKAENTEKCGKQNRLKNRTRAW